MNQWVYASLGGDDDVERLRSSVGWSNVDAILDGCGDWRALHCASYWGHVECVRWLLDLGASPNAPTGVRWTAVHLAAMRGATKVLSVLCEERGALMDCPDAVGRTPLSYALAAGHHEAAVLLMDCGASLQLVDPAPRWAVRYVNPVNRCQRVAIALLSLCPGHPALRCVARAVWASRFDMHWNAEWRVRRNVDGAAVVNDGKCLIQ